MLSLFSIKYYPINIDNDIKGKRGLLIKKIFGNKRMTVNGIIRLGALYTRNIFDLLNENA